MVEDALVELVDDAMAAAVPLALAPLHPALAATRSVLTTLAAALDLCEGLGAAGMGVAVDAHALWWDPALEAQIARAGAARLLALRLGDWLPETADPVAERGMPGDGVIDLRRLRAQVHAQGYRGLDTVVVTAAAWAARDPHVLLATARERHERLC
jgi:sugar phosphate isomerase/epimerase